MDRKKPTIEPVQSMLRLRSCLPFLSGNCIIYEMKKIPFVHSKAFNIKSSKHHAM